MPGFRRTAAVLAAGSVWLGLSFTPADAAASSYVALGDSYSSGTGTRSYLNDGTSCLRSVYAYPSLIASSRGYALNLRACSGATHHHRRHQPAARRAGVRDRVRNPHRRRQRRRLRLGAD